MKILYFDYWTKGLSHNILPLDKLLSKSGVDRIMVHLGSWRDSSVSNEEVIEGLKCRDIRCYGGSLRRMLMEERPDVVYVLNVGGVVDRLMNRICRNLHIRTVFMMHGIPPLGGNVAVEKKRLNKAFTLFKRLSKVPKYAMVYTQYLGEIARKNPLEIARPRTYAHLVQMLISPGSMYSDPCIDKDLYPNTALVYAKVYKKFYEERMQFDPIATIVVGNPNLDPVLSLASAPDSRARVSSLYEKLGIPLDKPIFVFLVDGLDDGLSTFTEEDWLNELKDVTDAVLAFGGRLILKLHPTNKKQLVQGLLGSVPGVHILQNEVDLSIVVGATATVGHISSALVIPLALNIPVFVPQWSKVYRDYDYYVSNGAAVPVVSVSDLIDKLHSVARGNAFDAVARQRFIEDYIGFADGKSWARIASEIRGGLSEKLM